MQRIFGVLAVLALAGCAANGQANLQAEADNYKAMTRAECQRVVDSTEVAPIRARIAFDPVNASLQQLADSARADEQQRAAIAAWDANSTQCRTMQIAGIDRFVGPDVGQVHREFQTESKAATADLWTGKITFGEFNARRADAATRANSKSSQILTARQLEADRASEGRRQAALRALANNPIQVAPAQQPYMMPVRPAVNTTCTGYGNTMNCTTR